MAGSVNKVTLVGNLGKDPEVRRMTSGEPVVNLSVATSESWRDKASGEKKERTEWHRVVIFNKNLAEVAEKYLRKGSKVYLEGALQTRKWTDKDGAEKYSTEVVLQNFRGELVMLDGRSGGEGGGRVGAGESPASFQRDEMDDEIPSRSDGQQKLQTFALSARPKKQVARPDAKSSALRGRCCRAGAGLFVALALAGCVSSSGQPAASIGEAGIAGAYIPLYVRTHLGLDSDEAAATRIAPGIAATDAHNANLLDPKSVIGQVRDYDLMFFRSPGAAAPLGPAPRPGDSVTAYGQGADAELRVAHGVVRQIQPCDGCGPAPAWFTFAGDAGPGFSGGPVVDTQGRLVGITFGYRDTPRERLIYAYDMARVDAELQRFQPH